ncbi:hypothetical protein TorRG33x02_071830, partial [Trema orientale]
ADILYIYNSIIQEYNIKMYNYKVAKCLTVLQWELLDFKHTESPHKSQSTLLKSPPPGKKKERTSPPEEKKKIHQDPKEVPVSVPSTTVISKMKQRGKLKLLMIRKEGTVSREVITFLITASG